MYTQECDLSVNKVGKNYGKQDSNSSKNRKYDRWFFVCAWYLMGRVTVCLFWWEAMGTFHIWVEVCFHIWVEVCASKLIGHHYYIRKKREDDTKLCKQVKNWWDDCQNRPMWLVIDKSQPKTNWFVAVGRANRPTYFDGKGTKWNMVGKLRCIFLQYLIIRKC